MRERQVWPNDVQVLVQAWEALVTEGKLCVNLQPLGLGDRVITGYALKTHEQLDRILAPVHKVNTIDHMSADQYRTYNDKLDREAGVKKLMSPRAAEEAERMFTAWFDSTPGYGRFESESRDRVKELIFEHLNDQEIPWSASAVAQATEYLHKRGVLHRESDVRSGQAGEFTYHGARMVIHPAPKNPVLNPPPQNIEIVERTKRITLQDLRKMSSMEYAEALRNPSLSAQIEALLAD